MYVDIEDASPRDLEELHEIEVKCFGKEAFTKQQIAYLLSDYNSISLAARIHRELTAFIIASIYAEGNSLAGHILTIDVLPCHRKKGVGFALMRAIEDIFKEKYVKTSHLEVREDNIAAIRLYEKLKYKRAGILENYYGNASGIYLTKKL